MVQYRRCREKFRAAIYRLAVGEGDVRDRLRGAYRYTYGNFKCLHAHCEGRKRDEFLTGFNIEPAPAGGADDFPVEVQPDAVESLNFPAPISRLTCPLTHGISFMVAGTCLRLVLALEIACGTSP